MGLIFCLPFTTLNTNTLEIVNYETKPQCYRCNNSACKGDHPYNSINRLIFSDDGWVAPLTLQKSMVAQW